MSKRKTAIAQLNIVNKDAIETIRKHISHFDDKLITSTEAYGKIKEFILEQHEEEKEQFEVELGLITKKK